LAHNGTLVNAELLKSELEAFGAIFRSSMDSEVIVHLIAQSNHAKLLDRITHALNLIKGAYSLVIMNEQELFAVRDPSGFRPLVLGKLDGAYVVASETCAFDLIEAEYIREIEPGEIVRITKGSVESFMPFGKSKKSYCIFEHIYFARPDSVLFGKSVAKVRKKLGRQLAREDSVDADLVIPVPDSGSHAALGYSIESKTPFDLGLIRSHYRGRTFIEPQQSIRHFGVKLKLNPIKSILEGKRVVVLDDSIVRGTTSRKIVKMIRKAGAKEVHMRISCPPTRYPCYYGIDTPTRKELIGATHSLEEIRKYITADSVQYLSMDGMLNVFTENQTEFCRACFDGNYPVHFLGMNELQMDLFDGE
ncbi:MAG: amidophosphoribosyltransferase, partial [Nitrospinota bacterium]